MGPETEPVTVPCWNCRGRGASGGCDSPPPSACYVCKGTGRLAAHVPGQAANEAQKQDSTAGWLQSELVKALKAGMEEADKHKETRRLLDISREACVELGRMFKDVTRERDKLFQELSAYHACFRVELLPDYHTADVMCAQIRYSKLAVRDMRIPLYEFVAARLAEKIEDAS